MLSVHSLDYVHKQQLTIFVLLKQTITHYPLQKLYSSQINSFGTSIIIRYYIYMQETFT